MPFHSAAEAAPARSWKPITPSNTDNLPAGCRGIYVGGAGNVELCGDDDVLSVFTAVPIGTFMPCGPKRVNAALTTATFLVALY